MDKASDCGSEEYRFNPYREHIFSRRGAGEVDQAVLEKQCSNKIGIVSSNLTLSVQTSSILTRILIFLVLYSTFHNHSLYHIISLPTLAM